MSLYRLRQGIADSTVLDWLELCEECPDGLFSMAWLQDHWQLSPSAACRRLQRLQAAGLIQHETSVGHRHLWRVLPDRLPVALPGGPSLAGLATTPPQ